MRDLLVDQRRRGAGTSPNARGAAWQSSGGQGRDGEWPKGRWTASTWTLLLLVAYGIPEDHPAARAPLERLLDRFIPPEQDVDGAFLLKRVDLCHLGFWLGLSAHFLPEDPRLSAAWCSHPKRATRRRRVELRRAQPPEHASQLIPYDIQRRSRTSGSQPRKGSSNTVRSARPNLARASSCSRIVCTAPTAQASRYRTGSHDLTYPWHWHYTFLRGLDYLRLTPAISDERLADPIDLLREKRKSNGRWPLQKRIPGTLLVEMERPGQESRWNTLRALRVLRARGDLADF